MAWNTVLRAIEIALDVEGLRSFDRGRLAELHERASWHVGVQAWAAPVSEASSDCGSARAPGGVYDLGRFGIDAETLGALLHRGGLRCVEDVERRTDGELLAIHRIGPKRLAMIRAAVNRYRSGKDSHHACT